MSEHAYYLTPREAAALLRITKRTLYRLLRAGEITGAVKIGNSWRIPAPEGYVKPDQLPKW